MQHKCQAVDNFFSKNSKKRSPTHALFACAGTCRFFYCSRSDNRRALSREHIATVPNTQIKHQARIQARWIDVVLKIDNVLSDSIHQADGLLLVVPAFLTTGANQPIPVGSNKNVLGLNAVTEKSLNAERRHLLPRVAVHEAIKQVRVDGHLDSRGHVDPRDENVREFVVDEHRRPAKRVVDGLAEIDGLLDSHDVVNTRIARLPFKPHHAARGFEHIIGPKRQHGIPCFMELHRRIVGIVHPAAGPCRPPDVDVCTQTI